MSMIKKRLWMGTAVAVALAVVVAVAYAADHYVGSFRTHSSYGGIGMGTAAVPADEQVIEWPDNQYIKGDSSIFGDTLSAVCDGGTVLLQTPDGSDAASVWTSTTGATMQTSTGFTAHANVGVDDGGNAWIQSVDGGSSVQATDDGDVIITLGP